MYRVLHALVLLLPISTLAIAHETPVAGFGSMSPDAPPETAQFDFLVGEWRCATRSMQPDGRLQDGPDATWIGYYILDGWAIQDDWFSLGPDGAPSRGSNIRSFNPQTGKWDNHWLAAGSLQWKYFEAEQLGETMVMTGGEFVDGQGRQIVDRNTFHDMTANAWHWRKDRSFDGGESWIEGVARIDCEAMTPISADLPPESRQFDFWLGRWDVNLRIREDGEWPESSVSAEAEIYSILDGKAVLELWNSETIKGFSLRYYDTDRDEWLLWLNWPGENRSGSSGLTGGFHHGRGDFYSERPNPDGGSTLARYSFNDITPSRLRWDDAYSDDGGETWRHQWRMEFSRSQRRVTLDPDGGEAHTFRAGGRCTLPEFRRFEALVGTHQGTIRTLQGSAWSEVSARLIGYRVLEGCAVLAFIESEALGESVESFHHLTWNTYASVFEETVLASAADSAMGVYYGKAQDGVLALERSGVLGETVVPRRREWRITPEGVEVSELVGLADGASWKTVVEANFVR